MISRGKEWDKEIVRESGVNMYTLLYLHRITNKILPYSTWNSAVLCGGLGGRGFGGEWIHLYGWASPFTVHLTLSQHC